ncbi:MAG: MarR family transcriptional regulator [Alphaproteobacteria bacterium]|nr:MarR family transcriptional regulator [Alphaproteobacteria bacterium]
MTSTAAIDVAHLIDRLDRLARSGEAVGELNPAQWEALRFVARANRFSRTPAALAEYLGSTRGTVSQTLIALEQKGHVTREPSLRDRRSIMLELTPMGAHAMRRDPILALAADIEATAPNQLEAVVEVLRTALHAMITRNGGRAFGACYTCRHFRKGGGSGRSEPHHCALLDEQLSEADSRAICVEQEA